MGGRGAKSSFTCIFKKGGQTKLQLCLGGVRYIKFVEAVLKRYH